MTPEEKVIAERRAAQIVRDHVKADVTGLAHELRLHDCDLGSHIMHGYPEDSMPAYFADEVWAVSEWLARELLNHDHRVVQWRDQFYWARGASGRSAPGQPIHLDSVIQDIAKAERRV